MMDGYLEIPLWHHHILRGVVKLWVVWNPPRWTLKAAATSPHTTLRFCTVFFYAYLCFWSFSFPSCSLIAHFTQTWTVTPIQIICSLSCHKETKRMSTSKTNTPHDSLLLCIIDFWNTSSLSSYRRLIQQCQAEHFSNVKFNDRRQARKKKKKKKRLEHRVIIIVFFFPKRKDVMLTFCLSLAAHLDDVLWAQQRSVPCNMLPVVAFSLEDMDFRKISWRIILIFMQLSTWSLKGFFFFLFFLYCVHVSSQRFY